MHWLKIFLVCILVSLFFTSCENKPSHPDTLSTGAIDISVDESYKPIIDEELRVFDSCYPDAKIKIHYKPENECIKDFFDSKSSLILVSRPLSKDENDACTKSNLYFTSLELAGDAIAVIFNTKSEDSLLDMDALKGILTGVYKKKYKVVFDNQSSGTVRYVTDSILRGEKLGANVFAAKGNNDVIDYVEKNIDAIGFVGLSYICDNKDSTKTGAFINRIKVASIKNDTLNEFYQPYQAYIALKSYPLSRKLYYISREGYAGLATGFANFLGREQGQLIFAHSHLFPLRMNIVIREALIKK